MYNIDQMGYCAKVPKHINHLYTFSVFKGLLKSSMVLNGNGKSNMVLNGIYDLVWSCLV